MPLVVCWILCNTLTANCYHVGTWRCLSPVFKFWVEPTPVSRHKLQAQHQLHQSYYSSQYSRTAQQKKKNQRQTEYGIALNTHRAGRVFHVSILVYGNGQKAYILGSDANPLVNRHQHHVMLHQYLANSHYVELRNRRMMLTFAGSNPPPSSLQLCSNSKQNLLCNGRLHLTHCTPMSTNAGFHIFILVSG